MAWDVPADSLRPLHQPGIGAVVAMVAAARMAQGSWKRAPGPEREHWTKRDDWEQDICHWWVGTSFIGIKGYEGDALACGSDEFDPSAIGLEAIEKVTCPDCLRMHAMVYGGAA